MLKNTVFIIALDFYKVYRNSFVKFLKRAHEKIINSTLLEKCCDLMQKDPFDSIGSEILKIHTWKWMLPFVNLLVSMPDF